MSTPAQKLRRMLAASVLAAAAATLAATPAAAHTELRGSDPEEGSTVETLDQVRLEFSSALLDIGSELILVDADGAEHELTPEFPAGEHAVVAPVDGQAVAAGAVVLDWRIVAEDGHPIEGEITFTYVPVMAEEPAEEPAVEPEQAPEGGSVDEPEAGQEPQATEEPAAINESAAAEEAEPTDQATPAAEDGLEADADSGGIPVWVWVVLGLTVGGLAVTAVALSKPRNTP